MDIESRLWLNGTMGWLVGVSVSVMESAIGNKGIAGLLIVLSTFWFYHCMNEALLETKGGK
jgi:predicted anti-sigma-YlaC factor YlaD